MRGEQSLPVQPFQHRAQFLYGGQSDRHWVTQLQWAGTCRRGFLRRLGGRPRTTFQRPPDRRVCPELFQERIRLRKKPCRQGSNFFL
jgi:hypothetical protein